MYVFNLCSNPENLILCLLLMEARPRQVPVQGHAAGQQGVPGKWPFSNPALQTPSDSLCLWCPFVAGSLSRQGLWAWSCCLSPSFPGLFNSQKEAAHLPQLPAILEGTGAHMHKSKFPDLELPQAQEDLGEAQDWGVGRRRPRSALWVPSVQGSLLGRCGFGPSTTPTSIWSWIVFFFSFFFFHPLESPLLGL